MGSEMCIGDRKGVCHGGRPLSVMLPRRLSAPVSVPRPGLAGTGQRIGSLGDVGTDGRIPATSDGGLVRIDLFQRREIGLLIRGSRGQCVQQVLRDLAGGGHRVAARRVAVALQPGQLTLDAVEIFLSLLPIPEPQRPDSV